MLPLLMGNNVGLSDKCVHCHTLIPGGVMQAFVIRLVCAGMFAVLSLMFCSPSIAQDVYEIKMSYNGPPDAEENAVHLFAQNFKRFVSTRTNDRIRITLYPNSQLGNEEQRMEQATWSVSNFIPPI